MIAKIANPIIGVIGGGGVGPEIVDSAIDCLYEVGRIGNKSFSLEYFDNNKWYAQANKEEPNTFFERGLVEFYHHIRARSGIVLQGPIPAPVLYRIREKCDKLYHITPLVGIPETASLTRFSKEDLRGLNLLLIRENVHGLFHPAISSACMERDRIKAETVIVYHEKDMEEFARFSFEQAKGREGYLHLAMPVRKMGDIGGLWEAVFDNTAKEYPEVRYSRMYPNMNNVARWVQTKEEFDNVSGPFDVIAGPDDLMDAFIDDAAWAMHGELTMACTGCLSRDREFAAYQTVHGTQRPIAGKDEANPIGMIHAAAMALRYSLDWEQGAQSIEVAVRQALAEGYRTPDLYNLHRDKEKVKKVGTKEMTEKIIGNLYCEAE